MDKTIIIGAGITGLSAGLFTKAPIYEAEYKPGGICRSYYRDGYRFENGGGHWLFGDEKVREFVSQFARLNSYKRNATVYYNQHFPYPIQQSQTEEGYYGHTLKGWLVNKFGFDMCRMFFWPFNEKYTAGLFDEVIQDDPAKSPTDGKGYNDTFSYPSISGLDGLVDRMAAEQEIFYGKRVVKIDMPRKIVFFGDGSSVEYDQMISTMPLRETLNMAGIENDLPYTSVLVVNLGAERGPRCPDSHWVYIPSKDCDFFRVGFYSNVDPSFAPRGDVSIYVERAFRPKSLDIGPAYIQQVIDKLSEWRWINAVKAIDLSWVDYGYTWLSVNSKREQYIETLRQNGILSIGRYGKWKFQGIVESIVDGMETAW